MMQTPAQTRATEELFPAGAMNLLVPGAGVIWVGSARAGLLSGLVFAALANLAVWAALLVRDDLPVWMPPLLVALAAAAYLACQAHFVRSVRDCRRQRDEAVRRTALVAVRESLERGDYNGALAALAPISHLATEDLLVAYRRAQVLTVLGDAQSAWSAWKQVHALDHHNIYRDEWRTAVDAALNSTDAGGDLPPTASLV